MNNIKEIDLTDVPELAKVDTQEIKDIYREIQRVTNEINALDLQDFNVDETEITKENEDGTPCAADGAVIGSFKKGGSWRLVDDLKGYPSHKNGGVDINIGPEGYSLNNKLGSDIKAEHGLVLKNIKANSEWELVKDLKGYPSHKDGGVELSLDDDGLSFHTLKKTKLKAKDGLFLPKIK